ncbi:hypothetical protein BDV95DRAFT_584947 [Massariosphaeria phaeospora]|uniref:Uncharacterized protein n=1 Tax=Massariosphaeria phaeospora TaxID=100035 RepID=A0A7C8I0U8_9PLEO|nr:hypothetical protein BDV95DRAFT_584947 [Massariosphaeria phaeospora]
MLFLLICASAVIATTMSSPNPRHQILPTCPEFSRQTYQAPLHWCDGLSGNVIKGNYLIILSRGYTFEDHCYNTRRDMTKYLRIYLNEMFFDAVGYTCDSVPDKVLVNIRTDIGVKEVWCDTNSRRELLQPIVSRSLHHY